MWWFGGLDECKGWLIDRSIDSVVFPSNRFDSNDCVHSHSYLGSMRRGPRRLDAEAALEAQEVRAGGQQEHRHRHRTERRRRWRVVLMILLIGAPKQLLQEKGRRRGGLGR